MNRLIILAIAAVPLAAQAPAHAPSPTGFPFSSDETLRYSINWASGVSLGEASLSAHRTEKGWDFSATAEARIAGYALSDKVNSSAVGTDLCSAQIERDLNHNSKHTRDKTEFDQREHTAHRATLLPEGGGKSDMEVPSCARDALTYVFLARREMGQGRVAAAQQVYFGSAYSVRMEYTGPQTIDSAGAGNKPTVTDHVVVYVKGPQADFHFEIFFARDAQRTPLSIRIPISFGPIALELVR
jgi:hypothetical protein